MLQMFKQISITGHLQILPGNIPFSSLAQNHKSLDKSASNILIGGRRNIL